jgi:ABC-2 type transport system permease protein
MHNLITVMWFEFSRTVKKWTFWLSVLAFPVIMIIIFAISFLSSQSASKAEEEANKEKFTAVVFDESGLVSSELLSAAQMRSIQNHEQGVNEVKTGQVDAYVHYPKDPIKEPVMVYAKDVGLMKNSKYTTAASEILKASVVNSVGSPDKVAIIQGSVKTDLISFDSNGNKVPGFERVIAPGLFLILFYLVIILLGNQMLTSTTEEKENRVVEMILTTVKAKTLIIGKILALIMIGLLQVAIISLPIILAFTFFGDKLDLPNINIRDLSVDPMQMLVGALVFVGAFLLFTGTLVTIGAAMPTAKEAGSFFGMAMFFMFVPLYAVMAIVTDPTQVIVKVFSFFPWTAPITLLLRNAAGNLNTADAAIGLGILLIAATLMISISIRTFRYGTLEYERKLNLKDIFKR